MAAREKQILIRFFVKSASAAACIACWATNKHMKSKTNLLAAAIFAAAMIDGLSQPITLAGSSKWRRVKSKFLSDENKHSNEQQAMKL